MRLGRATVVEKAERAVADAEAQRTKLAAEMERADARASAAETELAGIAALEAKAYLGEIDRAEVDRRRAAATSALSDARAELARLRRIEPELERLLAEKHADATAARQAEALELYRSVLAQRNDVAAELFSRAAKLLPIAGDLATRRDAAATARDALVELGAEWAPFAEEDEPEQQSFPAGARSLTAKDRRQVEDGVFRLDDRELLLVERDSPLSVLFLLLAGGPEQPNAVAAERSARSEADRHQGEREALRWAVTQGTREAVEMIPNHLRDEAWRQVEARRSEHERRVAEKRELERTNAG